MSLVMTVLASARLTRGPARYQSRKSQIAMKTSDLSAELKRRMNCLRSEIVRTRLDSVIDVHSTAVMNTW